MLDYEEILKETGIICPICGELALPDDICLECRWQNVGGKIEDEMECWRNVGNRFPPAEYRERYLKRKAEKEQNK